jgi:hypothetical protein
MTLITMNPEHIEFSPIAEMEQVVNKKDYIDGIPGITFLSIVRITLKNGNVYEFFDFLNGLQYPRGLSDLGLTLERKLVEDFAEVRTRIFSYAGNLYHYGYAIKKIFPPIKEINNAAELLTQEDKHSYLCAEEIQELYRILLNTRSFTIETFLKAFILYKKVVTQLRKTLEAKNDTSQQSSLNK